MLLKLGYIALGLIMSIIIIALDYKAKRQGEFKISIQLILSLVGWHLYVYLISLTEFIRNMDFPPRFVILTIVPAFLVIGIIANKIKDSQWLQNIPAHWLIFYQTFRIGIETLFAFSVVQGLLHPNVTLHGYNYDILYASSAFIIGWLVWKGNLKIGLYWNYLGLLVIAFIIMLFQTTIYAPELFGVDTPPFPSEFLQFPYILVPAFLMPSAVFIHIVSILQLRQKIAISKEEK